MTQQETATKTYLHFCYRGEALKVMQLSTIKFAKHYNLTSTLDLVNGVRNQVLAV